MAERQFLSMIRKKNVDAVNALGYTGIWYEDPMQLLRDLNLMRVFKGHSEFQQKRMESKVVKKKTRKVKKEVLQLIDDNEVELDSTASEKGL